MQKKKKVSIIKSKNTIHNYITRHTRVLYRRPQNEAPTIFLSFELKTLLKVECLFVLLIAVLCHFFFSYFSKFYFSLLLCKYN